MPNLTSLSRSISPPPRRKAPRTDTLQKLDSLPRSDITNDREDQDDNEWKDTPSLAAIEAGIAQIQDHLTYFAQHLKQAIRLTPTPRLSLDDFVALYARNQHAHGRHFVVHQHDHPISGVHYDLRLQFSESSTLSFAIPYGLPGNPNSIRPNRMAVETRVHNIWNNLIESASHATGSLLIWDTGEYEILPWREHRTKLTDDELSNEDDPNGNHLQRSRNDNLRKSFARHRIRLRLHGSKLPSNYTISMWLTSSNDRDKQPKRPARKRRRTDPTKVVKSEVNTSSDSEGTADRTDKPDDASIDAGEEEAAAAIASEGEEEATIRANNAYIGASNTIGSVHQRRWFLTLDRKNSGFRRARSGSETGRWVDGFEPFFVLGRDHERSVVTGRNAYQVMADGGVEKFAGRKMWQPILK